MNDQPSSRQPIFKTVIHTEGAGGYWAEVLELPGCFTQGATRDEIDRNLTDAIACHLGSDAIHVWAEES